MHVKFNPWKVPSVNHMQPKMVFRRVVPYYGTRTNGILFNGNHSENAAICQTSKLLISVYHRRGQLKKRFAIAIHKCTRSVFVAFPSNGSDEVERNILRCTAPTTRPTVSPV